MEGVIPDTKRLFEEVLRGRKLTYTPQQLAKEFLAYIEDLKANPIEVSTQYLRKKQKFKDEELQRQDRVEKFHRAPRIEDFVVRWLGKSMTWWSEISGDKYRDAEEFSNIKKQIQEFCRSVKLDGATAGVFNPVIIARELGLTDKQQVEQTQKQVVYYVANREEADRLQELAEIE